MPGTTLHPVGEILRETEEPYRTILRHVGQAIGFARAVELLGDLHVEAASVDRDAARASAVALREVLESQAWADYVTHVARRP